jgi:mannobiose 2-epimerase
VNDVAAALPGLGAALRQALGQLIDTWFPRVLDRELGGYLSDFDYRWRNRGPNEKMGEFEGRTLRFISRAALGRSELTPWADHGFHFVRDRMWDPRFGGFFRTVDRQGAPLEDGVKHGHATAYLISACVWYHRATGSREAVELAEKAFDWLDAHAHDAVHGGYYSFYRRDGSLILEPPAVAEGGTKARLLDPLGNPIGYKDSNTTVDLLEALGQLYEAAPSARLRSRLAESLDIVSRRVVCDPGVVHLAFTPDWKPLPHLTNYAQCLQTATLLLAASSALTGAEPDPSALATARRLVDRVVDVAWDQVHGGFHLGGSGFGLAHLRSGLTAIPDKSWWCQAEGLRALLSLAVAFPHDGYAQRAIALWRYIDDYVIDHRRGGWNSSGRDSPGFDRKDPKATTWKDPGHEGVALIASAAACDRLGG